MGFMDKIDSDKEIIELKDFIREKTGRAPGLLFWNGETIEQYRLRLRKMAEEIRNGNKTQ